MQKTSAHPDYVGNGSLQAIISQQMKRVSTVDDEYMIGLSYITEIPPGGTPAVQPMAGTITVTGSGSANTATIVLKVENKNAAGTANSDVSFTITVAAAKVDWSAGAASAFTLKDVIDLIEEDDAGGTSGKLLGGFKAWALDAPYDLQINAASALTTVAEAYVQAPGLTDAYSKALQRDISAHVVGSGYEVYYKRIGLPEPRDRGLFAFADIFGTVTGTTGGTVKIYKDDIEDFVEPVGTYATDLANHELFFSVAAASLSASAGSTPGAPPDVERAQIFRGPCILEIRASDLTAVDLRLLTQARD